MQRDQNEPFDEDEGDEALSKSEIKREMLALRTLGERLTRLNPQQWEAFHFSAQMLEALRESLRIKSHIALRRHYRRQGKLLREEDADLVRRLFERMDNAHMQDVRHFHRLERWRDRMLSEGDSAVEQLLDEYPNLDRQHLRQLLRTAAKEQQQGKSPTAARKLFKYLKEMAVD
ncbi:MAG: ribosome biogenesis factor YjgA [Candidatus Sedimenticola endophacoides]